LEEVRQRGTGPVPFYLRDKRDVFHGALREHYERTMREHQEPALSESNGYKYPHAYPEGWVEQRYLPEGVEADWFKPKGHGYEQEIIERLKNMKHKG
jgi:putative ATPase